MEKLKKKAEEMDLLKLRIIAISGVIFIFVFSLVVLYVGGKRMGLVNKNHFPLLELAGTEKNDRPPITIKGSELRMLKKAKGRRVMVIDGIRDVLLSTDTGGVGLKLTHVQVLLSKKLVRALQKHGENPLDWKGKNIEVIGILNFNPLYGFQIEPENSLNAIKIATSTK